MTWKYLGALLIAAAMVMACVMTRICSSSPDTFHGVLQLASSIAGGVFGLATANQRTKE